MSCLNDSVLLRRRSHLTDFLVEFFHLRNDKQGNNDRGADVRHRTGKENSVEAPKQRKDQNQRDEKHKLAQGGQDSRFERLSRSLKIVGRNNLKPGTEDAKQIDPHTLYCKIRERCTFMSKKADDLFREELTENPAGDQTDGSHNTAYFIGCFNPVILPGAAVKAKDWLGTDTEADGQGSQNHGNFRDDSHGAESNVAAAGSLQISVVDKRVV